MKTVDSAIITNDGKPPVEWGVPITHKKLNSGVHVFTSPTLPGLIVFNTDFQKAVDLLVPTIKAVIKKNNNIDCEVRLIGTTPDASHVEPSLAICKLPFFRNAA